MSVATVLVWSLGVSLAGCYATWDVSHHELAKLDGYRATQTVVLKGTDGEDVAFGPKSHLIIEDREVRIASASMVNGTFVGVTPAPASTTVRVTLTDSGKVIVAERSRFLIISGAVLCGIAAIALYAIVADPPIAYGFPRRDE